MESKKTTFKFLNQFKDAVMLGNGHVPAFLYCSHQPVLFDPGVSAFGPFYLKKIREHASSPESLIIALTHSHFDHCGAAPYLLRKIPGIRVAASTRAADVLQRPNAIEMIRSLNAEYEKEMKEELEKEDVYFEAINVCLKLKNGDRLELNDGEHCEILETPGHTRDCLSYFFPNSGVLLAGEAAGVFEGDFIHSPFLSSFKDYISSIEKLRALKPEALCIAHNGILTGRDISRFFSESLTAAKAYKDMIEKYLNAYNGEKERVVKRITAEEYDSQPEHIQKRRPFILNLEAKVNAVAQLEENADN